MNISLDEQIRKDKQKQRNTRHHHNNRNRTFNPRNRYDNNNNNNHNHNDNRFNHRQYNEQRQHREPRYLINISNLHYSVTREQLQEVCERFGKVKSCRIQWDKMGRSNQKATVEYFNKTEAQFALNKLKGTIFEEQTIQVQLVEDDSMPAKRHQIRKNYGGRYRNNNNHHHKTAGNWYK